MKKKKLVLFLLNKINTKGAHRLWSHRSYTAKWPFRLLLVIFSGFANQGSIYHWVRDHRVNSIFFFSPFFCDVNFFFYSLIFLKKKRFIIDTAKKKQILTMPILVFSILIWDGFWLKKIKKQSKRAKN